MQCYRHHDRSAVAVCRRCGKAACTDCCEDTGQGIACSENCAGELEETYRLTARLKQSLGIGRALPMPASVSMYAFFGAILLAVGVYLTFSRHNFDYLSFAMAAVFFVMSWLSYKQHRNMCLTC